MQSEITEPANAYEKELVDWYASEEYAALKKRFDSLMKKVKREGTRFLLSYLERNGYFECPSSTQFYLSEAGGLLKHSLQVFDNFSALCRKYKLKVPVESRIICSLFHDVCKLNTYNPQLTKKGEFKSKKYAWKPEFPFGHSEASVLIISKEIELTEQEQLMIRWHMGPYDSSYSIYRNLIDTRCPEANLLYLADQEAATIQKMTEAGYFDAVKPEKDKGGN